MKNPKPRQTGSSETMDVRAVAMNVMQIAAQTNKTISEVIAAMIQSETITWQQAVELREWLLENRP